MSRVCYFSDSRSGGDTRMATMAMAMALLRWRRNESESGGGGGKAYDICIAPQVTYRDFRGGTGPAQSAWSFLLVVPLYFFWL